LHPLGQGRAPHPRNSRARAGRTDLCEIELDP
jgi:hypothetical protein